MGVGRNICRWLKLFRKKDVSLGSHNPLCEYSHQPSAHMAGQGSSSNSNNYTTINYNHPQQHQVTCPENECCYIGNLVNTPFSLHIWHPDHLHFQLSDLTDNGHHGHPRHDHPRHRAHHQDSGHIAREEENCFVQEQYRNLLVHVRGFLANNCLNYRSLDHSIIIKNVWHNNRRK